MLFTHRFLYSFTTAVFSSGSSGAAVPLPSPRQQDATTAASQDCHCRRKHPGHGPFQNQKVNHRQAHPVSQADHDHVPRHCFPCPGHQTSCKGRHHQNPHAQVILPFPGKNLSCQGPGPHRRQCQTQSQANPNSGKNSSPVQSPPPRYLLCHRPPLLSLQPMNPFRE